MSYKEYLKKINTFVFDVDGVLTNGDIQISTSGELLRTMNTKDGFALKTAIDQGFNVCIISGGKNEGVRVRLQNLGVTDIFLGADDKTQLLKEYAKEKNIEFENIVFMGDDLPDYHVMTMVGLPACPQDAVPEIKTISKYVSHKQGGSGCVRDIIEQVLKVHGKWFSGNISATYD